MNLWFWSFQSFFSLTFEEQFFLTRTRYSPEILRIIIYYCKNLANFYQILRWVMSKPQKLSHLVWNDPGAIHFDLLWNLENPVLIQTLSYRRRISYHLFILIGFFHKLISMQMLGIFSIIYSSPAAIILHAPASYISCQWHDMLSWTISIWIWHWPIIKYCQTYSSQEWRQRSLTYNFHNIYTVSKRFKGTV